MIPDVITPREFADFIGRTERNVLQMAKRGLVIMEGRAKVSFRASVANLMTAAADEGDRPLKEAKAKLINLQIAEREGKLLPREVTERAFEAMGTTFAQLTRAVPNRVAAKPGIPADLRPQLIAWIKEEYAVAAEGALRPFLEFAEEQDKRTERRSGKAKANDLKTPKEKSK